MGGRIPWNTHRPTIWTDKIHEQTDTGALAGPISANKDQGSRLSVRKRRDCRGRYGAVCQFLWSISWKQSEKLSWDILIKWEMPRMYFWEMNDYFFLDLFCLRTSCNFYVVMSLQI